MKAISTFLSILLFTRIFLLNSIIKINASVWSLSLGCSCLGKSSFLAIGRMWFKRQWPHFIIPLLAINGITCLHHSIYSLKTQISLSPFLKCLKLLKYVKMSDQWILTSLLFLHISGFMYCNIAFNKRLMHTCFEHNKSSFINNDKLIKINCILHVVDK